MADQMDQEEIDCCVDSDGSSDSDSEQTMCEVEVEDDGRKETILVPTDVSSIPINLAQNLMGCFHHKGLQLLSKSS